MVGEHDAGQDGNSHNDAKVNRLHSAESRLCGSGPTFIHGGRTSTVGNRFRLGYRSRARTAI